MSSGGQAGPSNARIHALAPSHTPSPNRKFRQATTHTMAIHTVPASAGYKLKAKTTRGIQSSTRRVENIARALISDEEKAANYGVAPPSTSQDLTSDGQSTEAAASHEKVGATSKPQTVVKRWPTEETPVAHANHSDFANSFCRKSTFRTKSIRHSGRGSSNDRSTRAIQNSCPTNSRAGHLLRPQVRFEPNRDDFLRTSIFLPRRQAGAAGQQRGA